MSNTGKAIAWLVVLIVVVWAGYAILSSDQQGASTTVDSGTGPIKIGVLQALSGDLAALGGTQQKAIQMGVEEINAAGGINGRMIALSTEDDKCDPQAGGTGAQKLVNVDKVVAILGGTCSGATLSAAAITEPAHVIMISGSATSPKVTAIGDYVFRTIPSDALAGRVAARYNYEKLGSRKAAIISELTDYAQGLRGSYTDGFKALGGEIVADETYTTGDTDFRTQIAKIKAAKPDVIYVVPQTPTPGVAIVKQMKENGITMPVQTAEVLPAREVVRDNAAVLEGVYAVEVSVDYENNAKAKAFRDAYKAKFGQDPDVFAPNSYDALQLLRQAIAANNGKVDTNQIRDFLYAAKDWQGTVGTITMDQNGDPLLGLNVRKLSKGQVIDLGPYAP